MNYPIKSLNNNNYHKYLKKKLSLHRNLRKIIFCKFWLLSNTKLFYLGNNIHYNQFIMHLLVIIPLNNNYDDYVTLNTFIQITTNLYQCRSQLCTKNVDANDNVQICNYKICIKNDSNYNSM